MKYIYIFFLMSFIISCSVTPKSTLIEVGKGYSQTSVNTTIFRNSPLVTKNGQQFICFYNEDGVLTLGKRKSGNSEWTINKTQYQGNVKDAHNVISMTADDDGYLHVSFDQHNQTLNYVRSIEPYSLELGTKEAMIGREEDKVTYPEFHTLGNGDILFAYRYGKSGQGNLILNKYDVKEKKWSRLQDVLIDGEGQRSAYWQIYVDKVGTIHISWVWRETWMVETNHDLCYACSKDNGKTWQKSTGEVYQLPITASNAEYACYIPQQSELINQTGISADKEGHPYIATYWCDVTSDIPQYRIVWNDGSKWNKIQISNRKTSFSLKGGGTKMIPIARPRIFVNNNKVYYVFRDEERQSKVSMYCLNIPDIKLKSTTDNTQQIKTFDLTPFSVDAWEPSFDQELWRQKQKLNLFVQTSHQGDGEKAVESQPETVYVLEIK